MTRNTPNDLGDLPRMVPDRDDIVRRRGGPTTPPPPPDKSGGKSRSAPLWPIYLLLVVLFLGAGYLGYELNNSRLALSEAEAELASTGERLQELERQLSATDESLTMTDTAIQANFNNIFAEIRKLWDVSDGRNLEWIRDNQSAIASLNDVQQSRASEITQLFDALEDEVEQREALQAQVNDLGQLRDRVAGLQAREEELTARLDVVTVRVEGANELTTELSQEINQIDSYMISLARELDQEAETRAALSDTVSQLRNRVSALEDSGMDELSAAELAERIDVVDNARADTIQRLANLQAQVSELRNRLDENNGGDEVNEIEVIEAP